MALNSRQDTTLNDTTAQRAILAPWKPLLDELDIRIDTHLPIPEDTEFFMQGDALFIFRVVEAEEIARLIPDDMGTIRMRYAKARRCKVPFRHYVWGEEYKISPEKKPKIEYLLGGLENVGEVANKAADAIRNVFMSAGEALSQVKFDPILYGVIETSDNVGYWCCIGQWNDQAGPIT